MNDSFKILNGSAPEKTCPSCGEHVAQDAGSCPHCGYDWNQGRRQFDTEAEPAQHRLSDLALFGAIAIALIVLVRLALTVLEDDEPQRPLATDPQAQVEPTAKERTEPDVDAALRAMQREVPATTQPVTEEPPTPRVDPERTKLRNALEARLAKTRPTLLPGEEVALRQNNGVVVRGTIVELQQSTFVLKQEDHLREFDFKSFDHRTRLSIDKTYRTKYLDYQTERMIRQKQERASD